MATIGYAICFPFMLDFLAYHFRPRLLFCILNYTLLILLIYAPFLWAYQIEAGGEDIHIHILLLYCVYE